MSSTGIFRPRGIFINVEERIYVADHANGKIVFWDKDHINASRTLDVGAVFNYSDLFVGLNGDVYFENGNESGRIDKWSVDQNSTICVAKFSGHCYGLFIDFNNSLYCSQHDQNIITKISIYGKNHTKIIVAGNGSCGNAQNQLNTPWGIFVDRDFNLFVADSGNHRIQLFLQGQNDAKTVAGPGIRPGSNLSWPTDVVLARNGDLYVADNKHHRIVRFGGNKSNCVVGCTSENGSAANEISDAYAIQFDKKGNLYVADEHNNGIQMFALSNSTCGRPNERTRTKGFLSSSLLDPPPTTTTTTTTKESPSAGVSHRCSLRDSMKETICMRAEYRFFQEMIHPRVLFHVPTTVTKFIAVFSMAYVNMILRAKTVITALTILMSLSNTSARVQRISMGPIVKLIIDLVNRIPVGTTVSFLFPRNPQRKREIRL